MIQLYQGDCLAILPTIPDGSVNAIVTDPPYGINHKSGGGQNGKWHKVRHQGKRIRGDEKPFDPSPLLGLNVPLILWGANFYSDKLPGGGWLVWDKRHGIEEMEFNRSDSELAYYSEGKTVVTFRHLWHGICRATEVGQHLHPTQKPVALMRWCIQKLKLKPGSIILDPYMGSGSTGVAAIAEGMNFIGVELDEEHFRTAQRRIADAQASTPLLDRIGATS